MKVWVLKKNKQCNSDDKNILQQNIEKVVEVTNVYVWNNRHATLPAEGSKVRMNDFKEVGKRHKFW